MNDTGCKYFGVDAFYNYQPCQKWKLFGKIPKIQIAPATSILLLHVCLRLDCWIYFFILFHFAILWHLSMWGNPQKLSSPTFITFIINSPLQYRHIAHVVPTKMCSGQNPSLWLLWAKIWQIDSSMCLAWFLCPVHLHLSITLSLF